MSRNTVSTTPQMAEQAIATRVAPLPAVSLPLAMCAGQTLRQNVYAERENPPFDRVCMDGIAIDSAALASGERRFEIQGAQTAGAPPGALATSRAAIEVATGAVLPRGADCVIPLEEYDVHDGTAALHANASAARYRNVQRRGSDSRRDVPMLEAGIRLGAPEIAVAAAAGLANVMVTRQPRFVVIATGNELVEPGRPIADHEIRNSNAYALSAALREHDFSAVEIDQVRDDEAMLRERLSLHLTNRDVVILSGGVSQGRLDLVPGALRGVGVTQVFHEVAQRPGGPLWFGVGANGQTVFGLPGNPIAALICLVRYVLPAMAHAMGGRGPLVRRVALDAEIPVRRAVTHFMPVSLRHDDLGRTAAALRVTRGSGDFLALAGTDGFVELPPRAEAFPSGFLADFYGW